MYHNNVKIKFLICLKNTIRNEKQIEQKIIGKSSYNQLN